MKAGNSNLTSSRLRRSLLIYLGIALLILTALLSTSIITPLYNRLKKAENRNLVHTAEMKAMAIDEWGRRAREIALQITSRTRIRQELERYNRGEIDLEQIRSYTVPKLADAMNRSKEIIGITRLDKQNQVVAQYGAWINPAEWPELGFSEDVISTSTPVSIMGGLGMVYAARIKNRNGDNVGVDLVLINLYRLKAIVDDKVGFGNEIDIVLGYLKNSNALAIFSSKDDHGIRQQQKRFDGIEMLILQNALQGNSGIVRSGNAITAYHPIEGMEWGLLVSQGEKELYSSLNRILGIIIAVSAAIFLACLLGFRILLKPLSSRILLNTEELESIVQEKTEQINASLKEKEILLKEIHHRVKNNLSVVAGLLGIQAEGAEDQKLKAALNDSQNRVHTMSAIHEALYQSDNVAAIDLKIYMLDLGDQIMRSYEVNNNVGLDIDAESVFISIAQASPVGLIVNELITNSLKYGFPDSQPGEISISLKNLGNEIELVYTDDGVGFPNDFILENTDGLGLKLVKMLAENQLKGTLLLERKIGVRYVIRFKLT